MSKRVSELTISEIDRWVARAEHNPHPLARYATNWCGAGPIIQREKIEWDYDHDDELKGWPAWTALLYDFDKPIYGHRGYYELKAKARGSSPLIAAMRCYLMKVFGEEIDDERQ
jgi:hypothetical protein